MARRSRCAAVREAWLTRRRPRREPPDRGTPELQRQRAWLAGRGDPALTCYPLGILRANDVIGHAEHEAGCRYAWLHSVVFGRVTPAALAYEPPRTPVRRWTEERLADIERELAEARARVAGVCRTAVGLLEDLVVHNREPRWMRPVPPRPVDVCHGRIVLLALEELAVFFGFRTPDNWRAA